MMNASRRVATALGAYLLWTGATWWLEGRIGTLLRPEAGGDRAAYALIANLLIGIGGVALLLRRRHTPDGLDAARSGLGTPRRAAIAVAAGLAAGLAAYLLQGGALRSPMVLANAFAQVLVVSAAEVMVCWALLARAVEYALAPRGEAVALAGATLAASVAFGAYHFAHSPPFDTWGMVALLSAVGVATSAFFLASRDVAGTIVFHNFLGVFGVVRSLEASGQLSALQAPQPALFAMALAAVAAVAATYWWVRRRGS